MAGQCDRISSSSSLPTIPVLVTDLFVGSIDELSDKIISDINSSYPQTFCYSCTDAHGLVNAKLSKDFRTVLTTHFISLPDGLPSVWIGKLKGVRHMKRCDGYSLFSTIMQRTNESKIRHFILGGKEGVAQEVKRNCELIFNNHNIIGTFTPPFSDITSYDFKAIAKEINSAHTDILWIGLGSPKQEYFTAEIIKHVNVKCICTVGAVFDFVAGNIQRAPGLWQLLGFEWLFRLLVEPKRLFRRYLKTVPLFVFFGLLDLLTFYCKRLINKIKVTA